MRPDPAFRAPSKAKISIKHHPNNLRNGGFLIDVHGLTEGQRESLINVLGKCFKGSESMNGRNCVWIIIDGAEGLDVARRRVADLVRGNFPNELEMDQEAPADTGFSATWEDPEAFSPPSPEEGAIPSGLKDSAGEEVSHSDLYAQLMREVALSQAFSGLGFEGGVEIIFRNAEATVIPLSQPSVGLIDEIKGLVQAELQGLRQFFARRRFRRSYGKEGNYGRVGTLGELANIRWEGLPAQMGGAALEPALRQTSILIFPSDYPLDFVKLAYKAIEGRGMLLRGLDPPSKLKGL